MLLLVVSVNEVSQDGCCQLLSWGMYWCCACCDSAAGCDGTKMSGVSAGSLQLAAGMVLRVGDEGARPRRLNQAIKRRNLRSLKLVRAL